MMFDFQLPVSDVAVDWALAYTAAEMAVFPCGANNKPLTLPRFQGCDDRSGSNLRMVEAMAPR
jgi:hypothetical protein